MPSDPKTFTCDNCKQTFDQGWSDEEAAAELEQNIPGFDPSECSVFCDDCYNKFMVWHRASEPAEPAIADTRNAAEKALAQAWIDRVPFSTLSELIGEVLYGKYKP
jgi:hypothetical protein